MHDFKISRILHDIVCYHYIKCPSVRLSVCHGSKGGKSLENFQLLQVRTQRVHAMRSMLLWKLTITLVTDKSTRSFSILNQNEIRFYTYVSQRAEGEAATGHDEQLAWVASRGQGTSSPAHSSRKSWERTTRELTTFHKLARVVLQEMIRTVMCLRISTYNINSNTPSHLCSAFRKIGFVAVSLQLCC